MTSPEPDDRYLWDRTGGPDPDVASLERLLSPLAHRPRPLAALPPPRRRRRVRWIVAAAVAFVVLTAVPYAIRFERRGRGTSPVPPEATLVVAGDDLLDGEWVRATEGAREVSLGDVGRLRLAAGTHLRLDRLGEDVTRFFLRRGEVEASISAAARPRFFQVDTSAARCVDLGCRYTLAVDDEGVARVRVTTGQVSFETEDREVYVPAGAACVARPGSGPGTPCFEDAPAGLLAAAVAFDAAPREDAAARRALADRVLASVESRRDALVAWHLLQDRDDEVALRAARSLASKFGDAEDPPPREGRPTAEDREAWRERLSSDWY
jgi:hypothetical protein